MLTENVSVGGGPMPQDLVAEDVAQVNEHVVVARKFVSRQSSPAQLSVRRVPGGGVAPEQTPRDEPTQN